jgi:glycosyltransferase involved in cell wall biosynthesis
MKVLYLARLFSGLESSLIRGVWAPTGVPTIYKFVELLDVRASALRLVLAQKDGHTIWTATKPREIAMSELRASVRVLPGAARFGFLPRVLAAALREFSHFAAVLLEIVKFRPDVVYVDHGNVWQGGLIARFSNIPVVFRVMGVYPAMRAALVGPSATDALLRWLYRSPFAAVVCTQDGSGVETWLDRALAPTVPRSIMLNGIDPPVAASPSETVRGLPENACVVSFVGKLEPAKGAIQFIRAFLDAARLEPRLHALVIGTGSERDAIDKLVEHAGATARVTILDRVAHGEVLNALQRSDVYVSLNQLGNLSNANLEAMRVGVAMICPCAQPEVGIDVATDMLLPPDALWRIARTDDQEGLVAAMLALAADPAERARRAAAIRNAAKRFAWTWQARLDAEYAILEAVATGTTPPSGHHIPQRTSQ